MNGNDKDNAITSSFERSGSNTTTVPIVVITTYKISPRTGWSRHNNMINKERTLSLSLFCITAATT